MVVALRGWGLGAGARGKVCQAKSGAVVEL